MTFGHALQTAKRWRLVLNSRTNELRHGQISVTFRRVIESFGDKETEKLWQGRRTRFPADLLARAIDKLNLLDGATTLDTLRIPHSNRLEGLKGDRSGQHGIRINAQWRICFRWSEGTSHQVEITDYH
jgi:toxin HigB-1